MYAGATFIVMLVLCCGTKPPNNGQPTDYQVLGESGESAEEEVESVLGEYWKFWDGRIGCEGWGKGFDVGPGQVYVEEEENGAEADDGGLRCKLSVLFPSTVSEESVHRAAHHHAKGD